MKRVIALGLLLLALGGGTIEAAVEKAKTLKR